MKKSSIRSISTILPVICLAVAISAPDTIHAQDAWWNEGWPYRIEVDVTGNGIVSTEINFTSIFNELGLNHALLDVRSIRVVPYRNNSPETPLP